MIAETLCEDVFNETQQLIDAKQSKSISSNSQNFKEFITNFNSSINPELSDEMT